jgi:hypothetical protein
MIDPQQTANATTTMLQDALRDVVSGRTVHSALLVAICQTLHERVLTLESELAARTEARETVADI